MTVDEFFCSASQHRQLRNGSPGKSAKPAGGNRCRTTSFVIATVSTARHLRAAFARWAFATDRRTHLALAKDSPLTRSVHAVGRILPLPILGGLHHRYIRI